MGLEYPKTAEPVYSNHVPARKRKEKPLILGKDVLIFDHYITLVNVPAYLFLLWANPCVNLKLTSLINTPELAPRKHKQYTRLNNENT